MSENLISFYDSCICYIPEKDKFYIYDGASISRNNVYPEDWIFLGEGYIVCIDGITQSSGELLYFWLNPKFPHSKIPYAEKYIE